jgi:alkylated DNA repair protein alkB family protein 1
VELVDWRDVFGDSSEHDTEWGEGGPDWQTWTETYGGRIYFHPRDPLSNRFVQQEPDAGIVNFYQTKVRLAEPFMQGQKR